MATCNSFHKQRTVQRNRERTVELLFPLVDRNRVEFLHGRTILDCVHVEAGKDARHQQSVPARGEGHAHHGLVEGSHGERVLGGIHPDSHIAVVARRHQLAAVLLWLTVGYQDHRPVHAGNAVIIALRVLVRQNGPRFALEGGALRGIGRRHAPQVNRGICRAIRYGRRIQAPGCEHVGLRTPLTREDLRITRNGRPHLACVSLQRFHLRGQQLLRGLFLLHRVILHYA